MRNILNVGLTGADYTAKINANFNDVYRNNIKIADDYGFSTSSTATANVIALQAALLGGGTVYIKKGTYELNDTVLIDSNTHIYCEPGVVFKKVAGYCQVFLNRGALTREYNENITIDNLTIDGNMNIIPSTLVYGLNGSMCFYYIKYLTIRNFTSYNTPYDDLMLFFVRFEDINLDNIHITGLQCGLNFLCGKGGRIKKYIANTQDDGIFIGIGWPQNCTEIGDVSDLTFYECEDRPTLGQSHVGYFSRLYNGSWADWTNGNQYQTGDICLNEGHLYRNDNELDYSHTGTVPPTHTSGVVTGEDTLAWRYVQEDTNYKVDIYNISYIDCISTKNRPFIVPLNAIDTYARNIYPGTIGLSSIRDISIIGCKFNNTSQVILSACNLKNITISNCLFDGGYAVYYSDGNSVISPDKLYIIFTGNIIKDIFQLFTNSAPGSDMVISSSGNICTPSPVPIGIWPQSSTATIRIHGTDITYDTGTLAKLSPEIGDMVRDVDGVWIYKSGGWVNLAV